MSDEVSGDVDESLLIRCMGEGINNHLRFGFITLLVLFMGELQRHRQTMLTVGWKTNKNN